MKLIVECKRKKCEPPFEWIGDLQGTLRAKIIICAMCKHLKEEKP
jgi:hypothetical protein